MARSREQKLKLVLEQLSTLEGGEEGHDIADELLREALSLFKGESRLVGKIVTAYDNVQPKWYS